MSDQYLSILYTQKSEVAMISIILPTYNEAENIKIIIPMLNNLFVNEDIQSEIIIVDDNSSDGTAGIALTLAERYPVRVHVRKNERGLSSAVMKGFELAEGVICVVMDADLSHPIEKIPAMVKPILENRCDAVIGSRYLDGGGWERFSLLREIVSRMAGFLARGVTTLSDPTSGFMAIRKSIINEIRLDPLGWKIVLEATVMANPRIQEIPIMFAERRKGDSKLDFKAQFDYIRHLWRLYCYKYTRTFQFLRFCLVGTTGLLLDTAVLVSLVEFASFDPRIAAIFAFFITVSWNYVLNRIWTFNHGEKIKTIFSYLSFIAVCLIGLGIRIWIMHLLIKYAEMGESPWYILASVLGIVAATVFNFYGSKYLAFSELFRK